MNRSPRPHAELIKAWADGAEIQVRTNYYIGGWHDCNKPPIWYEHYEYRIKPEPIKIDYVVSAYVTKNDKGWYFAPSEKDNLKLTFDGETGQLKSAEVLK